MTTPAPQDQAAAAAAQKAEWHLATTPRVRDEAEYQHYQRQLVEMCARIEGEADFSAIAMAWAVMQRLKEFESSA